MQKRDWVSYWRRPPRPPRVWRHVEQLTKTGVCCRMRGRNTAVTAPWRDERRLRRSFTPVCSHMHCEPTAARLSTNSMALRCDISSRGRRITAGITLQVEEVGQKRNGLVRDQSRPVLILFCPKQLAETRFSACNFVARTTPACQSRVLLSAKAMSVTG